MPFLQTLKQCQSNYNENNENQFVNLTLVDSMPDMDITGNTSQINHNLSLMSMSSRKFVEHFDKE